MAKYSPKTKVELEKLINDESVNLGDIDTSAITDMSVIFYDCDRTDFSGIEKWDTSNVENMSNMFSGIYDKVKLPSWYLKQVENNADELVGMWAVDASLVCEQIKVAYIVEIDEDNEVVEILEKYPSRLQATWVLKDRLANNEIRYKNMDFFAVIGYEPNEITVESLEPLVGWDLLAADWLLRNCVRKAIAFHNPDSVYSYGKVGEIYSVYNTRLEVIEKIEKDCPDEWCESDTPQSLGYQLWFDVSMFVGKNVWFFIDVVRWLKDFEDNYWLIEQDDEEQTIIRFVEHFYSKDIAEEYETPQAKEGSTYVLIDSTGCGLE